MFLGIERKFENEINDKGKKFKIRGKIDRIDELNGEIRVIDYKSGKKLCSGAIEAYPTILKTMEQKW